MPGQRARGYLEISILPPIKPAFVMCQATHLINTSINKIQKQKPLFCNTLTILFSGKTPFSEEVLLILPELNAIVCAFKFISESEGH